MVPQKLFVSPVLRTSDYKGMFTVAHKQLSEIQLVLAIVSTVSAGRHDGFYFCWQGHLTWLTLAALQVSLSSQVSAHANHRPHRNSRQALVCSKCFSWFKKLLFYLSHLQSATPRAGASKSPRNISDKQSFKTTPELLTQQQWGWGPVICAWTNFQVMLMLVQVWGSSI